MTTALIVLAYAAVALVSMRILYPIVRKDGWDEPDRFAVLLGALWPITLACFVVFGGLAVAVTLLAEFAKGGRP